MEAKVLVVLLALSQARQYPTPWYRRIAAKRGKAE